MKHIDEVELIAEPITAVRAFNRASMTIDAAGSTMIVLESLTRPIFWTPGENQEFYCMHHTTPHFLCTCGLWACKEIEGLATAISATMQMGLFIAEVQLWGVIIEHEIGYRAQFARIIPETISSYPDLKPNNFLRRRYLGEC